MTILLICCTLMFLSACLSYSKNKQIAAQLFEKTINPNGSLPKSPYGLSREQGNRGTWGYCITKHGKVLYSRTGTKLTAEVFSDFEEALQEVNKIEALEGYVKSTV